MFAKKGLMAAALGLATIAGVSSASHAQIFGDNFDYHNPTRHSILDFSNDGPYGSNSPRRPGSYSHADDPQPAPGPVVKTATVRIYNHMGRTWALVVNGIRQEMPAGTVSTWTVRGPVDEANQVSFTFDLLNPSGYEPRPYKTPASEVHDTYILRDPSTGRATLRHNPHAYSG